MTAEEKQEVEERDGRVLRVRTVATSASPSTPPSTVVRHRNRKSKARAKFTAQEALAQWQQKYKTSKLAKVITSALQVADDIAPPLHHRTVSTEAEDSNDSADEKDLVILDGINGLSLSEKSNEADLLHLISVVRSNVLSLPPHKREQMKSRIKSMILDEPNHEHDDSARVPLAPTSPSPSTSSKLMAVKRRGPELHEAPNSDINEELLSNGGEATDAKASSLTARTIDSDADAARNQANDSGNDPEDKSYPLLYWKQNKDMDMYEKKDDFDKNVGRIRDDDPSNIAQFCRRFEVLLLPIVGDGNCLLYSLLWARNRTEPTMAEADALRLRLYNHMLTYTDESWERRVPPRVQTTDSTGRHMSPREYANKYLINRTPAIHLPSSVICAWQDLSTEHNKWDVYVLVSDGSPKLYVEKFPAPLTGNLGFAMIMLRTWTGKIGHYDLFTHDYGQWFWVEKSNEWFDVERYRHFPLLQHVNQLAEELQVPVTVVRQERAKQPDPSPNIKYSQIDS